MEKDDKDSSKDKYKSVDANEEFIINRKLYASRGLDYDELKRKQKKNNISTINRQRFIEDIPTIVQKF